MSDDVLRPRAPIVNLVSIHALRPADWNPRLIRDAAFKKLRGSIKADPEFLWRRPILAQADGTIYAGVQRWHAAKSLRWSEVPAILDNVDESTAQARSLRDNNHWGEYSDDETGELLYLLRESGEDVSLLGFDQDELERYGAGVGDGAGDAAPPVPTDDDDGAEYVYRIVVTCPDQDSQLALLAELEADGYECEPKVSRVKHAEG